VEGGSSSVHANHPTVANHLDGASTSPQLVYRPEGQSKVNQKSIKDQH